MTIDVPIFNGVELCAPLGFDGACAFDVPEDLMAVTPINGWDVAEPPADHWADMMAFEDPSPMFSAQAKSAVFSAHAAMMPLDEVDEVSSETSEMLSTPSSVSSSDDETTLIDAPMRKTGRAARRARQGRMPMKKAGPNRTMLASKLRAIVSTAEARSRDGEQTAIAEAAAQVSMLRESQAIEDPEVRRLTHNVLERKRRNDLKLSYKSLRRQLPALADNERCPTGQILTHAVDTIEALQAEARALEAGIRAAKLRRQQLLAAARA